MYAQVWSIASCEDGNWLASGGADSLMCLWKVRMYTVEPLNKGHFGANSFIPCREVVPISDIKY